MACAAPAASSARERVLDLRAQGDRGRLQVVDEVLAVVERRPALIDRVPQPAPYRLQLGLTPGRAEPVGLGVDRGGREPLRLRDQNHRVLAGRGTGSITSPAPATRHGRG